MICMIECDSMCCASRLMEVGPGEVAKAMKSDCGTRLDWQRCWSSSRRLRPQRARGPKTNSCPRPVCPVVTVVTVAAVIKIC